EGMTGKQLEAEYPDVTLGESYPADRGWAVDVTDESWDELYRRAERVKGELLRAHPVGSPAVALVTHAHFARFLVGALVGVVENPMEWTGHIRIGNCGVTCVEFRPGATHLHYSNARWHLEESQELSED